MKSALELNEVFREEGFKITPQRQRIFEALEAMQGSHPTADAVYAAVVDDLPAISLKTVYQTLNELVAIGELAQVRLGTGSARFDTTLDAHHHVVCDGCGAVIDVHTDFPGVEIPDGIVGDFEISDTEITFRGRCGACRAAASRST